MFDVNQFLTAMQRDGARPNLFEIFIPQIDNGTLRFKARATAIPSSTLGIAPVNYFGRQVKLAGNRVFDNWTVTIMLDEPDFQNGPRYALEQWSNAINTHAGNIRNPGYVPSNGYMRDATIRQYAKDGQSMIAQYTMTSCWPVDIGPVNLDWALDNQIAEFNVTFALQYWQSIATS
jgi:hypothetical protein